MKKSIIFILPDLETGGAERIVTTLANHLPREKYAPKIMLLRKKGGYLDLLKEDVEIIDLKTERIRNGLFPILKEIKKQQPDLVFSGFGEVNAYLSLFIKLFPKTKFIARETNVVTQHITRREILFFYRFYNNYHRIICQSDDMQQDLLNNFKIRKEKTVKINNPVDFDFITQKIQEEPFHFEHPTHRNVVAIGNLSSRKGFDHLLKVFTHLKDEPISLHILGDGRDADVLKKFKEENSLENVHFLGRQSNPYKYLAAADLFTLSSRYEGFPNVLLEAGACGTFSLANSCPGGINEIIQPGINGEISDITQAENFAERIKSLVFQIKDPEKIKNSIRSRFALPIILKQYEAVLDRLLSV